MAEQGTGVISDVEHFAEDVATDVKGAVEGVVEKVVGAPTAAVVAKVEAVATTIASDIVTALTHLGTAHNALSSIGTGPLGVEVQAIKADVEAAIVSFTKKIAA